MLEIIGTLVGLLYLWLEYRASIYVWLTGLIMPAIYIFVYYDAGLYADCAINVYYVLAAVYGVAMWRWEKPSQPAPAGEDRSVVLPSIIHTPLRLYPALFLSFSLIFLAIGLVLANFTDSTVPWWDAFTTALSIVAMYMLAHKHAEQWVAWIAVDAVCCGLYLYKNLYATSALYGIYTVIALFGYAKWCKMASEKQGRAG